VRREHPGVAVVVFTRTGDVDARIRALEIGAADAIDASFVMSQSVARISARMWAGYRHARGHDIIWGCAFCPGSFRRSS
jgi:DNA-binding response OmpR family regulator